MNTAFIEGKFRDMGARVKIGEPNSRLGQRDFSIDIGKDSEGEFFDIRVVENEIELMVLDVQKEDKHLLLMTKNLEDQRSPKSKFLCGHDERDWFTCAIPELTPVSTVIQAKEALKPKPLQKIESQEGLKTKLAHKRRRKLKSGKKIYRQGEFMFVPEPNFVLPKSSLTVVHENEPMQRGGGNAHYAQYLYRTGGQRVYVSSYSDEAANGVSEARRKELIKKDKRASKFTWSTRVLNPTVRVRGKISHKQHKTLDLGMTWHMVHLNTENKAAAARHVRFLD